MESMRDLVAAVAAVPYWYHRIKLPGGIVTPGWAPLFPTAYRIPERMDGMRVLDVGAWDGYWTWEALRRGAREVVAIDDFSDQNGASDPSIPALAPWASFDLCAQALGYGADRVTRLECSVYDVPRLGRFDVIFAFGVLYHLRHPLLALDRLAEVCPQGDIYIESAICDDYSPYELTRNGHRGVVMEFYPGAEYGGNPTNWWAPTAACLCAMVSAAGWPVVAAQKVVPPRDRGALDADSVVYRRAFVQGRHS